MRQDIENLANGEEVTLHPNSSNPIHSKPVKATFSDGYFFCEGTNPEEGPDYYWRDVFQYNKGFTAG